MVDATGAISGLPDYASPQVRYEHAHGVAQSKEEEEDRGIIYGCPDDGNQGLITSNRLLQLHVEEHVYPGGSEDLVEVVDKWVYAFDEAGVVMWAHAESPDVWTCYNEQQSNGWTTDGYMELDLCYTVGKLSFFLSPFELTDKATSYLMDNTSAMVTPMADDLHNPVPLCDPYQWAIDAHEGGYVPGLKSWKTWKLNLLRESKLFIASVIRSWIENDSDDDGKANELGVKNEVHTDELDDFFTEYEADETPLRDAAEAAASYVARSVDSHEFYAVEQAGKEAGGLALSWSLLAWAMVLEGMAETDNGQDFIAEMVEASDRLPSEYIFTEDPPSNMLQFSDLPPSESTVATDPPSNELHFSDKRFAYRAVLSIFLSMGPGVVGLLSKQGRPPLDKVMLYLEQLGVETLKGPYARVYRHVKEGMELTAGLRSGKKIAKARRKLEKLILKTEPMFPSQMQQQGQELDRFLSRNTKPVTTLLTVGVGLAIEVVNVANAFAAWSEAEGTERKYKFLYLMGAAADLTNLLLGLVDDVLKKGVAKRIVGGVAGAASMVSGIADMVMFSREAYREGVGERDYGAAAGYSYAAMGAGISALGGALVLAKAFGLSCAPAGAVGLIVGAVGATMIIGGCLLAIWLKKIPHEKFARYSFVGKSRTRSQFQPSWSPKKIPCKQDPVAEAEVLATLLSHFSVSGVVPYRGPLRRTSAVLLPGGAKLKIKPGYLYPDSVFEIVVENRWRGTEQTSLTRFEVLLDENLFVVTGGDNREDRGNSYIYRDEEGTVTGIELCVDSLLDTSSAEEHVLGYVRLLLDEEKGLYMPLKQEWVHISFGHGLEEEAGPDGSKVEATSLSEDRYVDTTPYDEAGS